MSTTGPFVSPPTPPTPPPPISANSAVVTPPSSTPTAAVTLPKPKLASIREWATPISILVLAFSIAFYAIYGRQDSVPSSVDGVALGRSYAPVFLGTYAAAWDVAADQLVAGKSVPEVQKAMVAAWKDARYKAFDQKVTPAFSKVLPEGTEPRDDSHRREVARVWHDFAKGLRKGK